MDLNPFGVGEVGWEALPLQGCDLVLVKKSIACLFGSCKRAHISESAFDCDSMHVSFHLLIALSDG